jgi:hypothetical protein
VHVKDKWIGSIYFSAETFRPMPPNSPWNPMRLSSYGVESIEYHGVPHCGYE